MIIGNGVRLTGNPNRFMAAPLTNTQVRSGWNSRGALMNIFTAPDADKKAGIPSGMRHPYVWLLPMKPGGLASRFDIEGTAGVTGNLAGGINVDAALNGAGTSSTAEAALIAAPAAAPTPAATAGTRFTSGGNTKSASAFHSFRNSFSL